jgi:hypothetical protein
MTTVLSVLAAIAAILIYWGFRTLTVNRLMMAAHEHKTVRVTDGSGRTRYAASLAGRIVKRYDRPCVHRLRVTALVCGWGRVRINVRQNAVWTVQDD